jgi:hypothetical protein
MSFIISGFIDEISEDFEEQLKVSHGLGLTHVCLRSIGKVNICDMPQSEIESVIIPLLNQYHLQVACLGTPLGKVYINDEEAIDDQRGKYSQIKDIAKLLDCSHIRVFSYYIPEGTSSGYWRAKVLENLTQMVDAFSQDGITVLHENEKDTYGSSSVNCLDLLETIGSKHFRAIFDFANFVQCQENPLEAFTLLYPYIDDFHIKDALSGSRKNVLCGTGSGKIYQIINGVRNEEKVYFATLEPHLVVFDALDSLELEPVTEVIGDNGFKTGAEGFIAQHGAFSKILEKQEPEI